MKVRNEVEIPMQKPEGALLTWTEFVQAVQDHAAVPDHAQVIPSYGGSKRYGQLTPILVVSWDTER